MDAAVELRILVEETVLRFVAKRAYGWSVPGGTQRSFLLAQGSEFTLVAPSILCVISFQLIANGAEALMDALLNAVVFATTALSRAAGHFWADWGMKLSRKLPERLRMDAPSPLAEASTDGARPVIVFGMTPNGRLATDVVRNLDLTHIVLNNDPERFLSAQITPILRERFAALEDAADARRCVRNLCRRRRLNAARPAPGKPLCAPNDK
jgi:hypothetical protein